MNDEIRATGDENAVLIAVQGIMLNSFIEFREWLYGNAKFPCDLSNVPGENCQQNDTANCNYCFDLKFILKVRLKFL